MFIDPTGMSKEDIEIGRNEVANRKLNSNEIKTVLSALQNITDDKLTFNKKNNRIEIKEFGKGDKKEGTELIRKLINNQNTVTININIDGKYGMVGATSGATNGDVENTTNGRGTDISISLGFGHEIYTMDSKGKVSVEKLSTTDMLTHELVHTIAQVNGETSPGFNNNTPVYYTDVNGNAQIEMIPKEEYLTIFGERISKKDKGYQYPTENRLRREQKKNKRINYLKTKQIKR
ncbi:M91 family zinc metallopeptidase [Capnocytophaga sp. ARDL2]|uniref:M91 family zinc metallopeptidase n=1 Tax=Capnocytophaga sp. ARDL2 TaxID=3238809 RepID=UPI0035588AA9